MNVLLLGAGGNVTNGIYRILKDDKYRNRRVFVSCVKNIPVMQEDYFMLSPYANDTLSLIELIASKEAIGDPGMARGGKTDCCRRPAMAGSRRTTIQSKR